MKPIAAALTMGVLLAGLAPAKADTLLRLVDVTFADGGTASGEIDINVYGYISWANITTTDGVSSTGQIVPGYTFDSGYTLFGPDFDAGFSIATTQDHYTLNLLAEVPVTAETGWADPLVAGYGTGLGSGEYCQWGACAGVSSYLGGRAIVSGELGIPEPASAAILATGALLAATARRRTRRQIAA